MQVYLKCLKLMSIVFLIVTCYQTSFSQKYSININIVPIQIDFTNISIVEKGLGYYKFESKPLFNYSLGFSFIRNSPHKFSNGLEVQLDYYIRKFNFIITEPVNEDISFYQADRFRNILTVGLKYFLQYKLSSKYLLECGVSFNEVLTDYNNYEYYTGAPTFFFDINNEKSGVLQVSERPEGPGSIENYFFVHFKGIYSISKKIEINFNAKLKPFGTDNSYNLIVRGRTMSMNPGTYSLNDTFIVDKYCFFGIGLAYKLL